MTRHEFTLALVHKACLLVRRSGSQRHLIMAIAHGMHAIARGTALHKGHPWLFSKLRPAYGSIQVVLLRQDGTAFGVGRTVQPLLL